MTLKNIITKSISISTLGLCFTVLSGCAVFDGGGYGESYSEGYSYTSYSDTYPDGSRRRVYGNGGHYGGGRVRVPESHHFANSATPTSHKDRDGNWIHSQNPNSYTIELDRNEKRAAVARTLHETPKSARMGQYKYQKDGKTMHGGVYGTYQSREAAEKAMSNLPAEVRSKAKIRNWGNVQNKSQRTASSNGGMTDSNSGSSNVDSGNSSVTETYGRPSIGDN